MDVKGNILNFWLPTGMYYKNNQWMTLTNVVVFTKYIKNGDKVEWQGDVDCCESS